MKKINNLTYLRVPEIYKKIKSEIGNSDIDGFTQEEIIGLLEEGKLKGQKIDNEWYSCQLHVSFYIRFLKDKEFYSKIHYAGAIGLDLTGIRLDGKILDIGGGGEGIIGQLKGDSVIAIDSRRSELEEAPEGGLKIEMDAKDLKFLDNTFDTVTSFFTLMYIPNTDLEKVFKEIFRVLKPNGEFVVWDIDIPSTEDNDKLAYQVALEVLLPQKTVFTGYGIGWANNEQSFEYIKQLGVSAGFEVVDYEGLGNKGFNIRFIKK